MNPISAATGAAGAIVRSILGWLGNRSDAKSKGQLAPPFRWDLIGTSAVTGAIAGLADPEPITAFLVGYFGSDLAGKGLRLIPGIKKIWPRV